MITISFSNNPGIWFDIPEYDLIGMICAATSIFNGAIKSKLPFDIEVSLTKKPEILPIEWGRSWTYNNKYSDIMKFCDKLQTEITDSYVGVIPIFCEPTQNNRPEVRYYLPKSRESDFDLKSEDNNDHCIEFIRGYNYLNSAILDALNDDIIYITEEVENPEYKDDWSTDKNYLNLCKLSNTPNDGVITTRVHGLSVPSYIWDIPKINEIYQEQLAANLLGLFLRDCSEEHHQYLLNKKSYLRFYLYQDAPDSYPYVYAYIRQIDNCTYQSHKNSLNSIEKDKLPCEVNLATKGYFWKFPVDEWKTKSIQHIEQFI